MNANEVKRLRDAAFILHPGGRGRVKGNTSLCEILTEIRRRDNPNAARVDENVLGRWLVDGIDERNDNCRLLLIFQRELRERGIKV